MARRQPVRYGNKIDFGRIFGAIYGASQEPKPNEYFDQAPGDIPYNLDVDASKLVNQRWQNKGQGIMLNAKQDERRLLIEAKKLADIEAIKEEAEAKRLFEIEKIRRQHLGDAITGNIPIDTFETNKKYRENNNLTGANSIKPFIAPSENTALAKMNALREADVSTAQKLVTERDFLDEQVTEKQFAEIDAAKNKSMLDRIGIEAMTRDKELFIGSEFEKARKPGYDNIVSGFRSEPPGNNLINIRTGDFTTMPGVRSVDEMVQIPSYGPQGTNAPPIMTQGALQRVNQNVPMSRGNIINKAAQSELELIPLAVDTIAKADTKLPDGTIVPAGQVIPKGTLIEHRRRVVP